MIKTLKRIIQSFRFRLSRSTYIDDQNIPISQLVNYIGKQLKEQEYNYYTNVQNTDEVLSKLKVFIGL